MSRLKTFSAWLFCTLTIVSGILLIGYVTACFSLWRAIPPADVFNPFVRFMTALLFTWVGHEVAKIIFESEKSA